MRADYRGMSDGCVHSRSGHSYMQSAKACTHARQQTQKLACMHAQVVQHKRGKQLTNARKEKVPSGRGDRASTV